MIVNLMDRLYKLSPFTNYVELLRTANAHLHSRAQLCWYQQLIDLICDKTKNTYSLFTDKHWLVARVQIYCSYFVSINLYYLDVVLKGDKHIVTQTQ